MRVRGAATVAAVAALIAPAAAAAPPVEVSRGSAVLSLDARFGLKLVKKGVNAGVIAPATQDSLEITLPVRGGRARSARDARIATDGGIEFEDPADQVRISLKQVALKVTGRRIELAGFALIDGEGFDRFAFADGRVAAARLRGDRYVVRRATLRLNGIAVAALNSQLVTTDFEVGERIGTVAVRARG